MTATRVHTRPSPPASAAVHGRPGLTKVPLRVAKDGEKLLAEEPELVRDAQKGDRAAFAVLIDRYWDRLYRWLCQLTHDSHAAEDLAQETFLKAFSAIHRFQAGTNFRAWLFRIGHNNFVNLHRSKGANHRHPLPADCPSHQEGPVDETLSREAAGTGRAAAAAEDFQAAFLPVDEGMSPIDRVGGVTERPLAVFARSCCKRCRLNCLADRGESGPCPRRDRGDQRMKCKHAQRGLLSTSGPRKLAAEVLAHLDECPACRTWHVRLQEIDRAVPRLPVPDSSDAKAAVIEQILAEPATLPFRKPWWKQGTASTRHCRCGRRSLPLILGQAFHECRPLPRQRPGPFEPQSRISRESPPAQKGRNIAASPRIWKRTQPGPRQRGRVGHRPNCTTT